MKLVRLMTLQKRSCGINVIYCAIFLRTNWDNIAKEYWGQFLMSSPISILWAQSETDKVFQRNSSHFNTQSFRPPICEVSSVKSKITRMKNQKNTIGVRETKKVIFVGKQKILIFFFELVRNFFRESYFLTQKIPKKIKYP